METHGKRCLREVSEWYRCNQMKVDGAEICRHLSFIDFGVVGCRVSVDFMADRWGTLTKF